MTETQRESRHSWSRFGSIILIAPRIELNDRSRCITNGLTIAAQVFLYYTLWTSLYGSIQTNVGGADVQQSISYSTLAVLCTSITWATRSSSKETVLALIRDGRIGYWFLRPLTPQRFYFLRTVGELIYGIAWLLLGASIAITAGLISPPSSSLALFASIAELTVGQIIAYYLRSCVDLACFWFTTNESTVRIYFFVQALMSGALLPLWFFPSWFNTISSWLPFELLYNNPLSVYVGRISTASTPRDLVVATCWAVILGGITRLLWQAAGRRVSMQGG